MRPDINPNDCNRFWLRLRRQALTDISRGTIMRKTEHAHKAGAAVGYCKHLRKFGKRLANKATRKAGKRGN